MLIFGEDSEGFKIEFNFAFVGPVESQLIVFTRLNLSKKSKL